MCFADDETFKVEPELIKDKETGKNVVVVDGDGGEFGKPLFNAYMKKHPTDREQWETTRIPTTNA